MSTESNVGKTSFAWNSIALANGGEQATQICNTKSGMTFCTTYNYMTKTGDLERITHTKATVVPGASLNQPSSGLCVDDFGNIYISGDKDANGKFIIKMFSSSNSTWSTLDKTFDYGIDHMCYDGANDVLYVTGKFIDQQNQFVIATYNPQNQTWGTVPSELVMPITDMCVDGAGLLYILGSFQNNAPFIAFWNGTTWAFLPATTYLTLESETVTICSDGVGAIYFNSGSDIISYAVMAKQYTKIPTELPFDPIDVFMHYVDGVLYYGTYGTSQGAQQMMCAITMYNGTSWTDITPPQLNPMSGSFISCLDGFDMTNTEHLIVGTNANFILDGKSLIH